MCKMAPWIIFILIFSSFEHLVYGDGKIKIKVLGYENPSGRDSNDKCCLGAPLPWPQPCEGNCDYRFELCLSKPGHTNCSYGKESFNGPQHKNTFNLTDGQVSTFKFHKWEGGFVINIKVRNGTRRIIDEFQETVNISNAFLKSEGNELFFTRHGNRTHNATTIHISVLPECNQNYYLGNCSRHCKSSLSCKGHFTCNRKGDKVCLPGWKSPDCRKPEKNSNISCLPRNGEFTSSVWNGTSVCSNGTTHTLELEISREHSDKPNPIQGIVHYGGRKIPVRGSFAAQLKGDVIRSNNTELEIRMQKINTTYLSVYTDPCQNAGFCYRIQSSTWCCCDDGTNNSTCSPTTTAPSVTVPTKKTNLPGVTSNPTTPKSSTTTETTSTTVNITSTKGSRSTPSPDTKTPSVHLSSIHTTKAAVTVTENIHTKPTVTSSTVPMSTKMSTVTNQSYSTSTTETPIPYLTGKEYEVILEAVQEELDKNNLQDLIRKAWLNANTLLKMADLHITVFMKEAMIEDRTFVTVIRYNVTLSSNKINTSTIEPTHDHLISVIRTVYDINVYYGKVKFYLESTFSLYVQGRPPLYEQWKNISKDIHTVWGKNANLSTDTFSVYIAAVEEYTEPNSDGKEVTRVYYVLCNGSSVVNDTCRVIQTFIKPISTWFTTAGTRHVYSGNVNSLLRSRLSFNLDIYGYLFKNDFNAIIQKLRALWNNTGKLEYHLESPLLEKDYSGENGEYLSRIRYFVSSSGRFTSHILKTKPSPEQINMTLATVLNPRGDMYRVYIGKTSYRSSSLLTLFVKDRVNVVDYSRIQTVLTELWHAQYSEWHYKINIVGTRSFIYTEGFVSQLLYRISSNSKDTIDGSQLSQLSLTNLKDLRKQNGELYEIVDRGQCEEERNLFKVHIHGIVSDFDIKFIERLLLNSWRNILNASEVNINVVRIGQLVRTGKHEDTKDMILISRIYYRVTNTTSSQNINRFSFSLMKPERIVNVINTSLSAMMTTSKYDNMKLYVMAKTESFISVDYSYHLMFETQIARLQYDKMKRELQKILKIYFDLNGTVFVSIYSQDEYYVPYDPSAHQYSSARTYWKLNFLIKEDTKWIYPTAVRKLNMSDLSQHLNVTGLNNKLYRVYTGYTGSLLPRGYQLNLLFTSIVHVNDWRRIEMSIQTAWQTQMNISVNATIENVEEVVDDTGKTFWRLVYYVRINGKLVYAGNWNHLDYTKLIFNFHNFYGHQYQSVSTGYNGNLWRISKAFQLAMYQPLNQSEQNALVNGLVSTWCKMVAAADSTCTTRTVARIISQTKDKLANGLQVWIIYYVMQYDGKTLDSSSWPNIDFNKLNLYLASQFHFKFFSTAKLDLSFSSQQYELRFTSQVKSQDYDAIKNAIKQAWIKTNKWNSDIRKLKVTFNSQDRMFNSNGQSQWVLKYHLQYNGKIVRPDLSQHINTTVLRQALTAAGHEYEVVRNHGESISNQVFSSLYINSWVHPEDKQKFKDALEKYYRHKTGHAKVTVNIGPIVKTLSETGGYVWKLSYLVLVNGSVQEHVNLNKPSKNEMYTWFNITSELGVKYVIKTNVSTTYTYLFYVDVSHRVTTQWYDQVKKLLEKIIVKSNPDLASCEHCISVNILKEDKIVTESGETAWRLHYSVFISGSKVDSTLVPLINMTALKDLGSLSFKGINGVTNTILDTHGQETVASSHALHYLVLNKPLATANEAQLKSAIQKVWSSAIGKNVTVIIGRNKEYIQQNGETVWIIDYFLQLNSKTLTTDMIPHLSISQQHSLKQTISTLRSPRNETYTMIDQHIDNLREFAIQFPLYFTKKVAEKDIVMIQEKLRKTWSSATGLKLSSIGIDITTQKEMLDEHGNSVWKLSYFLTKHNKTIDSTITEFRNITEILKQKLVLLVNVQGKTFDVITTTPTLFRYDQMFHVFLSAKMDWKAKEEFIKQIENMLTNTTQGTDVKVNIKRQEEYKDNQMQSVWKAVFVMSVNGKQLLPASFPFPPDTFKMTLTNSHGKIIERMLQKNSLHLHNPRNMFSVYFTRNVSYHTWHDLEVALLKEWYSINEYKHCSCLNISHWILTETINFSGRTIYKLSYFLTVNGTDVESMTATHLTFSETLNALENITQPDGSKLKPIELTEDKVISVKYLYKVLVDKPVMITHVKKIQSTLLTALQNSTHECCSEVVLKKQMKMVDLNGNVKWLLEFQVSKAGTPLDASLLPDIVHIRILKTVNKLFHDKYSFTIYNVNNALLDARHHLSFVFSDPLKKSEIDEIENICRKLKLNNQNVSVNSNTTSQEEFVDKWGISVWKLDMYLYWKGANGGITPYIPGWGFNGTLVNMTDLQTSIRKLTFVGLHGGHKLLDRHEDDLIAYSNILSFYVNQAVANSSIYRLQDKLETIWRQNVQAVVNMKNINIKIVRQEECIDIHGNMMSKVIYTVSTNGMALLSHTLPAINHTLIKNVLLQILASKGKYVLVATSQVYDYDKLFWVYLQKPVLKSDIIKFEQNLITIYRGMNIVAVKTQILFQEEVFTAKSSTKAWKVSYSLMSNNTIQDVRIYGNLNKQNVTTILLQNMSTRYTSAIVNEGAIVYRLSETFKLYVTKRVAQVDHIKFEAALENIWVHKMSENINVLITNEEEIVNQYGMFVYAIGYVIIQMEHVLSPATLPKVSVRGINVTSHLGEDYTLTTIQEHFRVEECLHVYLSQPLHRHNRKHVAHDITLSFNKLADELQNATLEWKGQTKFLSNSQRSTIWRQLFVITVNNKVVDYQRYHHLQTDAITLNVTAPNGGTYQVNTIDTLIGYSRVDMLFSITVIGRIQIDHLPYFKKSINASWLKKFSDVTIHLKPQEELVGDNGIIITQLPYFVSNGTTVIDPEVTADTNYKAVIGDVSASVPGFNYHLYTGHSTTAYSSCFGLIIKGSSEHLDRTSVHDVIKTTWDGKTNTPYLVINIINMEEFIGDFGIQLTRVIYSITVDKVLASPDTDVAPPTDGIQSNMKHVQWHLYRGNVKQRLSALYTIQIGNNDTKLTAKDRRLVESALLDAWRNHTNECKSKEFNCQIMISTAQTTIGYLSKNASTKEATYKTLSKVFYSVKSNVVFKPWLIKAPSVDFIQTTLRESNPLLEVWTRRNIISVRIMLITGYSVRLDKTKVIAALKLAWQDQSNVMKAEILDIQRYTDEKWNLLTKIEYFVHINGSNPEEYGYKIPKSSELTKSLKSSGLNGKDCSCKALRHRKLYLNKGEGHLNHSVVAEAIKTAWVDKNNETKELVKITEIHIKQSGNARRKRSAVTGSGLVDSNWETVLPIDYTVSVDGQEPNRLYITEPTDDEIRQHLQKAGLKDCECEPSKTGTIQLKGVTDDREKKDITDAIAKAVAAANPDVKPDDLDVKILDIKNNIKDAKGNPISSVTYAISRKDGDTIDAIRHPSDGQMTQALKQTGRSLVGTPDPVKDAGSDWQVPVGIVCAVLGGIFIIGIVGYCIHSRRQPKGDKHLRKLTDVETEIQPSEHSNQHLIGEHPSQKEYTIEYDHRDEAVRIHSHVEGAFVNPTYEQALTAEQFEVSSHL